MLARARQGVLLRDGIKVVLAGQPNVGKSSLLNALAGAELAIVTPIPGTTRDRVAGTIQIEGVPVHVVDTAGLRDSDDEVERIGIARSWGEIDDADALIFLHDLTRRRRCRLRRRRGAHRRAPAAALVAARGVLHVYNKADLVRCAGRLRRHRRLVGRPAPASRPCADACSRRPAGTRSPKASSSPARAISKRCGAPANTSGSALGHAAARDAALELLAEELRLAHDALGEITGAFTSDDLLGVIFSRFCIGK